MSITEWQELRGLVRDIQDKLPKLNCQERLELFADLTNGYCVHCGGLECRQFSCQCTNDE